VERGTSQVADGLYPAKTRLLSAFGAHLAKEPMFRWAVAIGRSFRADLVLPKR
jgi:hypothetical protein